VIQDRSLGARSFDILNLLILAILGLLCLLPFVHVVAISFSGAGPAAGGLVRFWPIDLTIANYELASRNDRLWTSFFWAIARAIVGTFLTLLVAILTAYPLSRSAQSFPARIVFVVFLLAVMLFDGGIIPRFMVVRWVGLYDTFWAMVIPFVFNPWIIILLMNFFRSLPKELEEAALIDGAGHFSILFRIYVPLSRPALATMTLFALVGLWNDWFFPSLYLRDSGLYPLQTYLQLFLNQANITELFRQGNIEAFLALVSNRGLRAATLVIAMIPILLIYPLLQRYFVKGIVLGAVKE